MNTKEQVSEWDRILDEYENSIGLGTYKADSFSEAYRLGQFAFHVQRSLNREFSRLNWADESIKDIIADEINNYKGYGYIEKSLQAIKHNDKASALNKIKKYAKQRSDRLQYLANNIKHLSDIMLSIQKTKVKHGT
jgi:hypothetical protein